MFGLTCHSRFVKDLQEGIEYVTVPEKQAPVVQTLDSAIHRINH